MEQTVRFGKTVIIGCVFVLLIVIFDPIRVILSKGASLTSDYSIGAAFFYFFLIILINGFIRIFSKSASLSAPELIIIFGMMAVGCAIPTWGFTLNLIPMLPGMYYYGDAGLREVLLPHIKEWLTITDTNSINWFFEGLPRGENIPWAVWVKPLSYWFILILAVYILSIIIMVLISRKWIEDERLLYPLTIVPHRLSEKTKEHLFPDIFRQKLFWGGFLFPLIVLSIKSLNTYFPLFPELRFEWTLPFFRRTNYLYIRLYFEVIALMFFVPAEISLSIWLFYLLMFFQTGMFNIMGISFPSPEPWTISGVAVGYESMGAMFMMVLLMLWKERIYWKQTLRNKENYLLLSTGLLCFLTIVFWLTLTGLKFYYSIVFTVIAFLTFTGITRVVCEAGTPYARSGAVPAGITLNLFGSKAISAGGVTALGFTSPWACDLRTMVMTSIANFLKLAHSFKIPVKKVIIAGISAIILGLIGSSWSIINLAYKYGAINLGGWQFTSYVPYTMRWMRDYIVNPLGFGKYQFFFLGVGGTVYIILWFLRIRFIGFPIHPIGLTISATWPVSVTWFSIFLGWFFKFMVLRYGGQKVYKNTQLFFMGIIVGTFTAGGLWMLIDFATGIIPATHPVFGI